MCVSVLGSLILLKVVCNLGDQLWSMPSNLSFSGCPDLHTGLEKNQGEFRIGGVLQHPGLAGSKGVGREGLLQGS